MSQLLLRAAVRTLFALTTRARATRQIQRLEQRYAALLESGDPDIGSRAIHVPPMPGIDDDMRDWSYFMILEHNAIVNRSIAEIVRSLAHGEAPRGFGAIDPKKDVMPSPDAGSEQIESFRKSVEAYLLQLPKLGRLRGTPVRTHPVFGPFDAHRWHCMFGFHLALHYRQARFVIQTAVSQTS